LKNRILSLLEADGPRLYRLLYRLTLREDVAGDLLQDLFVRLCESAPFKAARDPGAYARKTAINLALEWRRQRRPTMSVQSVDIPGVGQNPVQEMIRDEELSSVLDAVSMLSSDAARECFVMRYLEQESYETIAAHTGKTPHQVRGLCHAAVKQIRTIVSADSVAESERQVSDV
jgi:RNA polymerase sigma-70 factor, ECF subfamily